jgi:hypothetical protein
MPFAQFPMAVFCNLTAQYHNQGIQFHKAKTEHFNHHKKLSCCPITNFYMTSQELLTTT